MAVRLSFIILVVALFMLAETMATGTPGPEATSI